MTKPRADSFAEWIRRQPDDTDVSPYAAWYAGREQAEKELRESRAVIEYYEGSRMSEDTEEVDTESFFHCSPLKKRDPAINGVMKSKYLRGGKRARAYLEKYPQDKELE